RVGRAPACRPAQRDLFKVATPLLDDPGLYDLRERARIEGRTADKRPVDIGLAKKRLRIVRLDATAVLDADFFRNPGVGQNTNDLADKGVSFLRLFRRGRATGADGPDRFVGNHDFRDRFRIETGKAPAKLTFENFLHATCIALLERFPNAKNRLQARFQCGDHLLVYDGIRLAKKGAPFAVAEDHITDKQIAQHGGADFAGK